MRTAKSWAVVALAAAAAAGCSDDTTAPVTSWEAVLLAANEVPAVNSTASATAQFALNGTGDSLIYSINITSPTGTTVTQAHIHSGSAGGTGGILVWLCGSATNPGPAGTPACAAGTATGELIAGRVAVAEAVITSARVFATYANVHSTTFTGGEIRGQLRNIVQ